MKPAKKPRARTVPSRAVGAWEVLQEWEVYSAAPWFRVFRQEVRLPAGRVISDYHRIQFPDYVIVVPRTADHRLVMVRKYTHGFRQMCLLFPGGLINAGERPRQAAKRELLEETGFASPRWTALGHFMPHSNYGCGQVHFFLAEDCRRSREPDSGDLEEMQVCTVSEQAAARHVCSGKNPSLGCVAAYLLAQERLASRKRRRRSSPANRKHGQ